MVKSIRFYGKIKGGSRWHLRKGDIELKTWLAPIVAYEQMTGLVIVGFNRNNHLCAQRIGGHNRWAVRPEKSLRVWVKWARGLIYVIVGFGSNVRSQSIKSRDVVKTQIPAHEMVKHVSIDLQRQAVPPANFTKHG